MARIDTRVPLSLAAVQATIVSCERCSRLRTYCRRVAREKKRAHLLDTYWGLPVPGFGDPDARLLLVGLAPAAHGSNRTGRMFTGDGPGGAGDFLMAALHRTGFANLATSRHKNDGLRLTDAYMLSAVRCAPPSNKPLPEEITRCLDHLDAELHQLPGVRVVVALGKIGFDAWLQRLRRHGAVFSPKPQFGHGVVVPPGRAEARQDDAVEPASGSVEPDSGSAKPGKGSAGISRTDSLADWLLPSEPPEHEHRQAHGQDDGRRVQTGAPAAGAMTAHDPDITRPRRHSSALARVARPADSANQPRALPTQTRELTGYQGQRPWLVHGRCASRTRTAMSGRLLINPSTPQASRRRMSVSSSTVHTCTLTFCRVRVLDETLRHDPEKAGPFRHLVPAVPCAANRPPGPRAIYRQPGLGTTRAARHFRQGGAGGGRAARAEPSGTHAGGGSGGTDLAGNGLAHLARVHLHFNDERNVWVLPQHVAKRGNADPLLTKGIVATAGKPAPGVDPREISGRSGCQRPGRRGRPIERRIVVHDRGTPSADRWTSSSRPSAPACIPRANAASVFSGPSAQPPRCANTRGRRWSKKDTCR